MPSIDPDLPILDLGIDSLDLLEWTFVIEEKTGLDIDVQLVDDLAPDSSIRDVFKLISAALAAEPS